MSQAQLTIVGLKTAMTAANGPRRLAARAAIIAVGALLLAVTLRAQSSSAQSPAGDPYPGSKLTAQQIMDKLTSADPGTKPSIEQGKGIYETVCGACHVFGDLGKAVGPDLTSVASRFRESDLLDSILWPSKTISDQYSVTMVELNDGSFQSGFVVREDRMYLYLRNADYPERPLPIPLANIKDRTTSTISLMPEHLVAPYTLDQIDSLIAFLLTGR